MRVVSNTSPICYLLLIDEIHLLPEIFGTIFIPEAVRSELLHEGAPEIVRDWMAKPPLWLEIETRAIPVSPDLLRLHPGEREAIALAKELNADLVILDEKIARKMAVDIGLSVTGLLGVLSEAA